jgi:hypothetical protein
LLKDYENAGKTTNAARDFAEQFARKLGITTDEALAKINTQMGVTLADYIRSISGTAASDTEVQRLVGNMASVKNLPGLNSAIISQLRENAYNAPKSMIETRLYGMENLAPEIFSDIYGTASEPKSSVPQNDPYSAWLSGQSSGAGSASSINNPFAR